MMYLSQAYVYFVIFGDDFSPSEFTKQVNLKPTDFGLKGEKRKSGATLKECFWKYQLNKTNALEELEKSLLNLVDVFKDKVDFINNYMIQNSLKSKCFIVIESKNNENNGVEINPNFIRFLHELNASIEIDIYSES
ncbi:MAG: DUF4279 domain-containing protein [Paludibacter sp.]